MADSPRTSRIAASSSPAALESAIISAKDPTMLPIITWSMSLARAASPAVGPRSQRLLPMTSRPGSAASNAAWSPPQRKRSVPSLASLHPPDTGAARKPVRGAAAVMASPTCSPVAASTVEQST